MENEKCVVIFLPVGVTAVVPRGTLLSDAAASVNVAIGRHCGGAGVCGKCRVRTERGKDPLSALNETERKILSDQDRNDGIRLSCCAAVERDGEVTVIDGVESAGHSILEGFSESIAGWAPCAEGYGVSVDIGTTTVVCYLLDLDSRREAGRISFLNPQVVFGDDVISRIAYASSAAEALEKIRRTLTDEMDEKIGLLAEREGIEKEKISEITVAGNTVMEHIFAGVSPESIGRSPYRPQFLSLPPFRASEAGINIAKNGLIKLLPNVAGYVGADIAAGVAALGIDETEGIKMLVDIGTNNEIVIGGAKGLYCCATAAGPAFEGARIQYGMRASTGAIDRLFIEEGELRYSTIGGAKPIGLCGSGLIDAVALALREGLINSGGRFIKPESCADPRFRERLGRNDKGMTQLLLTDGDNPVCLTQKDIREVQLAAGAVKVGIGVMLEEAGISADELSEVCLAGAFGNNINMESAAAIGLIPDIDRNKIRSVKNSSGLGASLALASADFYERTKRTAEKMRYIELSSLPDFQERFVSAMAL